MKGENASQILFSHSWKLKAQKHHIHFIKYLLHIEIDLTRFIYKYLKQQNLVSLVGQGEVRETRWLVGHNLVQWWLNLFITSL